MKQYDILITNGVPFYAKESVGKPDAPKFEGMVVETMRKEHLSCSTGDCDPVKNTSPAALRREKQPADIFYWAVVFGLFLWLLFLCFYQLGQVPIADWDEARHGVNAYEMMKNGEQLISTYRYRTDYYNLKPPLSCWLIELGYGLFGFNALGLRFYSALSLLATAALCTRYSRRVFGKTAALFTLLGFICCQPFWGAHAARFGDADMLYVFCFTTAVLAMSRLRERPGLLYLCGAMFALAFLSKGWHAGVLAVTGALYLLVTKLAFRYKLRQWAGFALVSAGPVAVWATLRTLRDGPRFLQRMLLRDVLARAGRVIEGHTGTWHYYLDYLVDNKAGCVFCLLAAAGLVLWLVRPGAKTAKGKDTRWALWLAVLVPLVLFSFAESKLFWYVFCVFPPLILLASSGLCLLRRALPAGWARCGVCVCAVAVCLMTGVANTRTVMAPAWGNPATALAAMTARTADFSGQRLYIQKSEDPADCKWSQSETLTAEFAGDFRVAGGGLKNWQLKQDGYLFLPGAQLPLVTVPYTLVAQDGTYCLLRSGS